MAKRSRSFFCPLPTFSAHYSLVGKDLDMFSEAGFDMEKIVRLSSYFGAPQCPLNIARFST